MGGLIPRLTFALMTLSAIFAAVACDPPEDPRVEVTNVSLNQSSVSMKVGASVSLTATVSPSNATDKAVTWSSSNAGIASVSNGVVSAVSEGEATITASAGGKSATCNVTVLPNTVAVTGISLNKTSLSVYVNDTFQLQATVSPSNATDKTVKWTSSDSVVVKVDQNGLITALSPGTATVTAECGGFTAKCAVECRSALTGGNEDYGYIDI